MPSAGRVSEHEKITSSMPLPRRRRGDCSPIAQRMASTTFDLPQPLGPTIPVMPGSNSKTTFSTKDLKPWICSDLIRTQTPSRGQARTFLPVARRGGCWGVVRRYHPDRGVGKWVPEKKPEFARDAARGPLPPSRLRGPGPGEPPPPPPPPP